MYIIIHHVITGRPGGMLSRRRFTDSRGGGITRGQNKGGLGPSTSEICPPPPLLLAQRFRSVLSAETSDPDEQNTVMVSKPRGGDSFPDSSTREPWLPLCSLAALSLLSTRGPPSSQQR